MSFAASLLSATVIRFLIAVTFSHFLVGDTDLSLRSGSRPTRRRKAGLSSPLKWHGGKHYLAKIIIALMPPHLHYIEPYGGSLAVLLERDPNRDWLSDDNGAVLPSSTRGCSEVVNDLHGNLMNFWTVLQDPQTFYEFQRIVAAIPFSEQNWELSGELTCQENAAERAVGFFIRCRQSRAGTFKDFATLSRNRTRRGMNEQASAWLTTIEGLPQVHARLKRVVILNHDALQVIRQQDGDKTLYYLDPPYLFETRASTGQYDYEMTETEHGELLAVLSKCQGKFMLSGYPSDLYDSMAVKCGWRHIDFDPPNNAGGGEVKRRMTERIWMNFEPRAK